MKVALIHNFHDASVPSGEDATVDAEAAALSRAGHEVRVLGAKNDERTVRKFSSIQAAATLITGVGVSPAAEINEWRPDVVHVHNLFPFVGRRWLNDVSSPIVTTAHSFRAMCINGYLFRAGEVCTRCLDGSPWSGVKFGCYRDSRIASLPPAIANRKGPVNDRVFAVSQQILVLSERARSVMTAAGLPTSKLRLDHHFIPDSLDLGAHGETSEAFVYVGRLTAEKGIDRLLDEWPADVPLRVVGGGPLRPSLEVAARDKNVEFLGQLNRQEVMAQVSRAFGLVFPSRWYETFGLTYIEALAAGVPTLAFPPNVVADAVQRDGTGIIGTWGDLAGTVAAARASFGGLRSRCRQVFEERYTESAFLGRRTALYEEVAA